MALICFTISVISTFQCCCSRHIKNAFEHLLRVSSFLLPWFCAAFPCLYRFYTCSEGSRDCEAGESLRLFVINTVLYALGGFALATNLPERLSPGTFDFVGHSHQVMHVCVALGGYFQFESVRMEMVRNEDALRSTEINQIYSIYNLPLTMAALVANVLIATYFPLVRSYLFKKEPVKTE